MTSEKHKVWSLLRQDDNGNHFVIEKQLTKQEATRKKEEYEAKGHKQLYWIKEEKPSFQGKIVFVDVDDTLIRTVSSKRIPIPATITKISELYNQDCQMYCWSSGGAEYAREIANELQIEHCFIGFLPKPDIMVDDQGPEKWTTLRVIHPNQLDVE